jgi:hypothetical protein
MTPPKVQHRLICSTQGDGLIEDIVARLEQAVADSSEGRVGVSSIPTGPTLIWDRNGDELVDS